VSVKVKICGVRTLAIVEAAANAGADFIGLVFYPKSPRHVGFDEARALADATRGRLGSVAVLVDPDDALIDRLAASVRPSLLQLHGRETPARIAAIKARSGLPVMKAIPVADALDVAEADRYGGIADTILFDAKASPEAPLPGGNGVPFDWRVLQGTASPFALSGGLTPENVGEAIRLTGASLVDVSSGVERAPGVKDARLVEAFVRAAKARSPQHEARAS
jgi:phosphoribosylanthranilate isomerase